MVYFDQELFGNVFEDFVEVVVEVVLEVFEVYCFDFYVIVVGVDKVELEVVVKVFYFVNIVFVFFLVYWVFFFYEVEGFKNFEVFWEVCYSDFCFISYFCEFCFFVVYGFQDVEVCSWFFQFVFQ